MKPRYYLTSCPRGPSRGSRYGWILSSSGCRRLRQAELWNRWKRSPGRKRKGRHSSFRKPGTTPERRANAFFFYEQAEAFAYGVRLKGRKRYLRHEWDDINRHEVKRSWKRYRDHQYKLTKTISQSKAKRREKQKIRFNAWWEKFLEERGWRSLAKPKASSSQIGG